MSNDPQTIRWCETHDSPKTSTWCEKKTAADIPLRRGSLSADCRFVDRVVLPARPDWHPEIVEQNCEECEGIGWFRGYPDIHGIRHEQACGECDGVGRVPVAVVWWQECDKCGGKGERYEVWAGRGIVDQKDPKPCDACHRGRIYSAGFIDDGREAFLLVPLPEREVRGVL